MGPPKVCNRVRGRYLVRVSVRIALELGLQISTCIGLHIFGPLGLRTYGLPPRNTEPTDDEDVMASDFLKRSLLAAVLHIELE